MDFQMFEPLKGDDKYYININHSVKTFLNVKILKNLVKNSLL